MAGRTAVSLAHRPFVSSRKYFQRFRGIPLLCDVYLIGIFFPGIFTIKTISYDDETSAVEYEKY